MIDEQLREQHYQRVTNEAARGMYERLCAACEQRPGGLSGADQMLIGDVAFAEQIKQLLMDDIAARGLSMKRYNGRQEYWQENRSPAQYRAYCDQQRKMLAELKLTPASRKAEQVVLEDEFDKFE